MKDYWMHRISYERNVKQILLDEDNLLVTGWGMISNDIFLNKVFHVKRELFDSIYQKHFGKLSRNRYCVYMFINEFKKGDYVVVPGSSKDFSVYEVVGERPYTKEHLHEYIKSEKGRKAVSYQNGKYFDDSGNDLELGFFWEVKPVELNIPREGFAENELRIRLKFQMTNIKMTDLYEQIEAAISNKRNNSLIRLNSEIAGPVSNIILKKLKSSINDVGLERVVKWYIDKIGASSSIIPPKKNLGKNQGDADVVAWFDELQVMLVIQVKQYKRIVNENAVRQIVLANHYYDTQYPAYTSIKWLVTTCNNFSDKALDMAEQENVRLIGGDEFANMILNVGIKDMNV